MDISQPFGIFLLYVLLNATHGRQTHKRRIYFPGEINPLNTDEVPTSRKFCYVDSQKGECRPYENYFQFRRCIELKNEIEHSILFPGFANYPRNNKSQENCKFCCLSHRTSSAPGPVVLMRPFPRTAPGVIAPPPRFPSLSECSVTKNGRVTHGRDFTHGKHHWLVGIGYPDVNVSLRVHCGGTLITKRHVLSAAHCFVREPTQNLRELTHAILGEHSLSSDTEKRRPLILRLITVKHPGYDQQTLSHDIALLVLERDVSFTEYIQPACLPFSLKSEDIDFSKNKAVVVGWGKKSFFDREEADRPQEANVSFIPKEECQWAYSFNREIYLDDSKICFGGQHKDSCQGDSGGPLVYKSDRRPGYFIIGVVNAGRYCGSPFYPGIYSYVPFYLSWINENL